KGWSIIKTDTDNNAVGQKIIVPLTYKNDLIQNFEFFASENVIFIAEHTNKQMVCRLIRITGTNNIAIFQQIRTRQITGNT
ncbi:hypothetical protein ACFL7D_08295, partial [candidate division KSB1 bacterium]